MAIAVMETITYETVFAQAQSLPPEDQGKLVLALSKRLSASVQVRLVMQLLPGVAPTVEAVIHNNPSLIVQGGTSEATQALLAKWLAEPALDEDAESWDQVMHNLGAYGAPH